MHTQEAEGLSMKVLLKQVYSFHTSRIKALEEENESLKNKLNESELRILELSKECKRCVELEEAFKSCKAALDEQSKWFENLGQRFSVFTSIGNESREKPPEINILRATDNLINESALDKSSNTKRHLLKNIMSINVNENLDSLDLSSQFPLVADSPSLKSNPQILAPDTIDILNKIKPSKEVETDFNWSPVNEAYQGRPKKSSGESDSPDEGSSSSCRNTFRKKRQNLHLGNSEPNPKRYSMENSDKENADKSQSSHNESKKQLKTSCSLQASDRINKTQTNNEDDDILILDAQSSSVASNGIKNGRVMPDSAKLTIPTSKKETCTTISPSLIPIGKKTDAEKHDKLILKDEDMSDFEEPNTKPKCFLGDAWTTCDKKKPSKQPSQKILKSLKSTSKFKMSLAPLPPDYKKPTYRQTKLSKSIFFPKSAIVTKQTLSPRKESADFDLTCIPEHYRCDVVIDEESANDISDEDIDLNDSDQHSLPVSDLSEDNWKVKDDVGKKNGNIPGDVESTNKPGNCKKKFKSKLESTNYDPKDNKGNASLPISSFDRLPRKQEPKYAYKEDTVRKKSERMQLNPYDCKECQNYYGELGLSDEQKHERMKKCSRHRAKFVPPPTPDHFWELGFPDTLECKARGYLDETQMGKLTTHRKRPL